MQDFTKELNAKTQAPINRLAATQTGWLTKTRFWNFVFWIGMSLGFTITFTIVEANEAKGEFSYWTSFFFWLTLIGVPTLVRFGSKTTFVKNNIFLNSQGEEINLKKDLPNGFWIVFTTIAITALTGTILDKSLGNTSNPSSNFILIAVFFLIPTLFFIFKNCPISILFNRKLWKFEAYTNGELSKSDDSRYYNPIYSSYLSNIHHRYRR